MGSCTSCWKGQDDGEKREEEDEESLVNPLSCVCGEKGNLFLLRMRIFMDKNTCMGLPVGWKPCPMDNFGCNNNLCWKFTFLFYWNFETGSCGWVFFCFQFCKKWVLGVNGLGEYGGVFPRPDSLFSWIVLPLVFSQVLEGCVKGILFCLIYL